MPVVKFGPARWRNEQEETLMEQRRLFRDPNEQRLITLVRRYGEWMKCQDPVISQEWSRVDSYVRFTVHIYPNISSATTNGFDTLQRYGVRADDIEGAIDRIKVHYMKAFLKKWASTYELRKVPTISVDLLAKYVTVEGESDLDLQYRALLYGLFATGGRVPCLVHAKKVAWSTNRTHLIVKWSRRKKDRSETTYSYPTAWSFPAPADVANYLASEKRFWPAGWTLGTSSVNSHMRAKRLAKKLGRAVTSRAGRVRMVHHLLERVQNGELTKEEYKIALDHTVETGLKSYARPMDDAEDGEVSTESSEDDE